jgi:hypothetical protein
MEAILILFVLLTSLAGIGAAASTFGTDTSDGILREDNGD